MTRHARYATSCASLALVVCVTLGLSAASASTTPTRNRSTSAAQVLVIDGMRLIDSIRFEGGSEIAADRRFVYANQLDGTTARGQHPDQGGVRLLSIRKGRLVEHGHLHCPGNDNDVQPLTKTTLVMAHHDNRCNPGHGLIFVDIRDPHKPRIDATVSLPDGAAHTVTPHPKAPFVYVSPGGLFNGSGSETIVKVAKAGPSVVGTFEPNPAGCHDLTMMQRGPSTFAFCSGLGETSIWDVTDPIDPLIVGHIPNPAAEFMYVAQPSPDGRYLAIVDEAFVGHECALGLGPGGVWLYDIEQLTAPVLIGRIAPPQRGSSPVATPDDVTTWCASHGIAWHPKIPHLLAVTWYTAGISVFDISAPAAPVEVAAFQATDSLAEAAAWHGGLLYTNDLRRGVDVFALEPISRTDSTQDILNHAGGAHGLRANPVK